MPQWTSNDIAQVLDARLYGESQTVFGGSFDSRQVRQGQIFFALKGEKVDGHDYIEKAWENGAVLAIAEKSEASKLETVIIPPGKGLLLIDSVLEGMHLLAHAWRKKIGSKVVAITGSNGKTTTKDMIAAVVSQSYRVYKNKENFNNEIGLPLTILNAPVDTEVLIVEMGMRGLGQIEFLCKTSEPDIGVITNIGTTHLELLGSQENIAQAKWELIDALEPEGQAILNAEDAWSCHKAKSFKGKSLFYGISGEYHQAHVKGSDLTPQGITGTTFNVSYGLEETNVYLPLPGEHNILDALAALSVGVALGVPLKYGAEGLRTLELSKMRLEIKRGAFGSVIISDVYNANPASMKASLGILADRAERHTIAVLGDMYELGSAEHSGHQEVGEAVTQYRITRLVTVGSLAKDIALGATQAGMPKEHVIVTNTREEAIDAVRNLLSQLGSNTWVLVKASRGMKMEEVTKGLEI